MVSRIERRAAASEKVSGGRVPGRVVKHGVIYTRLYLGLPCRHGHDGTRYLTNDQCVGCTKEQTKKRKNRITTAGVTAYAKARQAADPKKYWAARRAPTLRYRAAYAGVPFNLDPDYILSLCHDTCPALGIPLTYVATRHGVQDDNSAALDRLRPELGYVRGNVAVISTLANRIKTNATGGSVMAVAKWMEKMGL